MRFARALWSKMRKSGPEPAPPPAEPAVDADSAPQAPVEGDVDRLLQDGFFPDPAYRIVEVGVAKPDYLSISASFRRRGWKVLEIEPNPAFCALHRKAGNEVVECACGEADRDDVPFSIVESTGDYLGQRVTNESFSLLPRGEGKFADLMETADVSVPEIRVAVRCLDTILAERGIAAADIDILTSTSKAGSSRFSPARRPDKDRSHDRGEPLRRAALRRRGLRPWLCPLETRRAQRRLRPP